MHVHTHTQVIGNCFNPFRAGIQLPCTTCNGWEKLSEMFVLIP